MILVDEPRWPAHGRLWAHLVSDVSLEELHAFAQATGVPPRSFDADHYDVPEDRVASLVAAGAVAVAPRELLSRLVAAGLRVRQRDKPQRRLAEPSGTCGVVLAAGAGSRYGMPKALARDADGVPWVRARVAVLRDAGCDPVLVVLGAGAAQAGPLVPEGVRVVVAEDWSRGMSASLQAALRAAVALDPAPASALIALVDVPGLTVAAVKRVVAAGESAPLEALARACYHGRPGHPVLLGRHHWMDVADAAVGDRGAGPYLRRAGAELVECADVADGADVDSP